MEAPGPVIALYSAFSVTEGGGMRTENCLIIGDGVTSGNADSMLLPLVFFVLLSLILSSSRTGIVS